MSDEPNNFSVTLYGSGGEPPEFRVDVIAPNEGVQFEAYLGSDFDRALRAGLAEAAFHGLDLSYSFGGAPNV